MANMSDPNQSAPIVAVDPGVVQELRPSAGRLAQLEDVFTEQLHYEVAGLIPDLPSYLDGDDWAFCQRTVQALLWSALTDEPAHVVAGALRRLGTVNQVAGFPEEQYLGLTHALLRAVRELTENDWSTALGSAWISYFQWIQGQLVTGAQQAPWPAQPPLAAEPEPQPQPEDSEAGLEPEAAQLDEPDDEETGDSQIMVSTTRGRHRDPLRPG
jgi:hypothetical protein